MVVPHGHPRIVVRNDADLPHGRTQILYVGGRGSFMQTNMDLPCGFRLKMVETRRRTLCATTLKDQETRCKDGSNYHYRNRTYLDMKYE